MNVDGLVEELRRKAPEWELARWATFRAEMRGRPIDEIRAAMAERWTGDWTDEELAVIRDGGEIAMRVHLKP